MRLIGILFLKIWSFEYLDFSRFFPDFLFHFLLNYSINLYHKKVGLFAQDHGADVARRADMAHKADVARATRADATRHTRPCGKAVRAHARRRWRGHVAVATQVHADAQGGATW